MTRTSASTAAARPASRSSSRPTSRIAPASSQTRPIVAKAVTPSAALRLPARERVACGAGRRVDADPADDPGAAGDQVAGQRRVDEHEDGQREQQDEQVEVAERVHDDSRLAWSGVLPARAAGRRGPAPAPRVAAEARRRCEQRAALSRPREGADRARSLGGPTATAIRRRVAVSGVVEVRVFQVSVTS